MSEQMVQVAAHLFNPETGERAVYTHEHLVLDDPEYDLCGVVWFLWTDGNFGCDCNRSTFLERALGKIGPNEFGELVCGDGGIIVEKLVEVATGRVIAENI